MMTASGTRKAALMMLNELGIDYCLRFRMSAYECISPLGPHRFIALARFSITPWMLAPTAEKAPITASVTRAAATAYSESSRPDSSVRNFLIMVSPRGLESGEVSLTKTKTIGGVIEAAEVRTQEFKAGSFSKMRFKTDSCALAKRRRVFRRAV